LSTNADEESSTAFPDPVSPLLAPIARDALEGYQSGEINIGRAILHAVVNEWYESHIEGEECASCPKHPDDTDQNHLRQHPG
jgi:hypothetical protein